MNRTREAVTMAAAACKQLNNSPQSLTVSFGATAIENIEAFHYFSYVLEF